MRSVEKKPRPRPPAGRLALPASLLFPVLPALSLAVLGPGPGCRKRPPAAPDAAPAGGPAWSAVELPRATYSTVEKLRRKTQAGNDRFVVEVLDEKIRPTLEGLKQLLASPSTATAGSLLSADFTSSALVPDTLERNFEAPGIRVDTGVPRASTVDRDGFAAAAARWIRPLEELDRSELKVVSIDGGSEPTAAVVHYLLSGADDAGKRYQWSGRARLSFDAGGRALRGWETIDWSRSEIDSPPFEDVTAAALGSSPNFERIQASLDDFRARLDAASGIDVYGHHGVSVGDADGDGRDDIYVPMPAGISNFLFRAAGDGTFDDVSESSGADIVDGTSHALFVDVENDGDEDLLLVTDVDVLLLVNRGKGTFVPGRGVPSRPTSSSTPIAAALADYDLDGLVDVYVCSYVFWRGVAGAAGSRLPLPYHEAHNGAPNFLLRNLGGGRFEDVTEKAGLMPGNNRFSFAAGWSDYDNDGDADLYVANDFGTNNLYRNNGDGTFTDVAREAGVLDAGPGMSVAWEDHDNDGDLDLYVGNMFTAAGRRVTGRRDYKSADPELQATYRRHARGNSLFRNRADGTFDDISLTSSAHFGRWAWASDFFDFNLDGHEDIYVQNGFITNTRSHDL